MKVNKIQWASIKMQWESKLASAQAFMGIKDYEEMMTRHAVQQAQQDPDFDAFEEFGMTPEQFNELHEPVRDLTEKEKIYDQSVALREQLNEAIAEDRFEAAQALHDTLKVLEIKYNKL